MSDRDDPKSPAREWALAEAERLLPCLRVQGRWGTIFARCEDVVESFGYCRHCEPNGMRAAITTALAALAEERDALREEVIYNRGLANVYAARSQCLQCQCWEDDGVSYECDGDTVWHDDGDECLGGPAIIEAMACALAGGKRDG